MIASQLSPDFLKFIVHLFHRQTSAFFIVLGRRGTGKTDFALLVAEILVYFQVIEHVATNIKIYHASFPITEITNLEDLRLWAKDMHGRKLFIFDEVAKALPRRRPMANLTVELLNEFQILRKHKLSILATTITEEQTDNAILSPSIIDGYFLKPNWADPKVIQYQDFLQPLYGDWHDLPQTTIQYDTWDSAPFQKQGEKQRPKFKTQDLQHLWDLTHEKTAEDLGLHSQQVARLWRKFVKEVLEREHHASP